eukprot:COSAG06_NODE_12426_length_1384_cov_1.086381_1_plen_264_part_10
MQARTEELLRGVLLACDHPKTKRIEARVRVEGGRIGLRKDLPKINPMRLPFFALLLAQAASAQDGGSSVAAFTIVEPDWVEPAATDVASSTETAPPANWAPELSSTSDAGQCTCDFVDGDLLTRGCDNDVCSNCGNCPQSQFSHDGTNFYRYCSCSGNGQCSDQCPNYDPNAAPDRHPGWRCPMQDGTEIEISCNIFSTVSDECREDLCWCYCQSEGACPTSAARIGGAVAAAVLLCACCIFGCRKMCKCCKSDDADAEAALLG